MAEGIEFALAEDSREGAVPVDKEAVEAVLEKSQEAPIQAPKRRGRKPGSKNKPKEGEQLAPAAPAIDPEMMKLIKGQLVGAYELALTLIASARVAFTPEEQQPVGDGLVYCIETYLPDGFTKHVPLVFLGVISLQAVQRAREQKKESERNA